MVNSESNPLHHETTDSTGQDETEPQPVRLSSKQMLALPIMAAVPNLTQAAKAAGISESTLRRWRRDEHFRAELDRLTAEIAETTRQGLKDVTLQGFRVINELMEDSDPMVRLQAAQAAVLLGIRVYKAEEFRREEPESTGPPERE